MAKRIKVSINGVNVQMWKIPRQNRVKVRIAGEEAYLQFSEEGAEIEDGFVPVDIRSKLSQTIVQYFYFPRNGAKSNI